MRVTVGVGMALQALGASMVVTIPASAGCGWAVLVALTLWSRRAGR
ncbi:MAG: hypothetical protein OXC99_02940 [Chloroflexi bacterium]|nr:hypothetical protein [Chloroflexota bacterium]